VEQKTSLPVENLEVVIGGKKILPADINTTQHFGGSFDEYETEVSARYVVRLLQQKGGWKPFTYEDINNFYQEKTGDKSSNFTWNALIEGKNKRNFASGVSYVDGGWIKKLDDGRYQVTKGFVEKVYKSSPKK
jgi:catalase (peroxidase I)